MEVFKTAAQIMCDTETEMYKALGSAVVGRAGIDPAPYWGH